MKYRLLRLALGVPLLIVCAWPRTSVAQAAIADAVLTWGDNSQTPVPLAAQSGVTAIAAGSGHTVALKNDGSVVAWGYNEYGQTTVPPAAQSGVRAIAGGEAHTVALKNDGSVVAWGQNGFAQTNVPVAAQSGVIAIAAGSSHTVALKNDGSVVAWGNGSRLTNVPVEARSGVIAIAAGGGHTVALKNNGSVVAWGYNEYGQTTVPAAAQSGVTAIAAGASHTVALKNDGTVVAWGYNGSGGQVTGTPTTNSPYSAIASPVTLGSQVLRGVKAIAAGSFHTVALKNDGTVVAWGNNSAGQTTVPKAGRSGVSAIAAGGWQTVALVIPTSPRITTQPVGQAVSLWQTASFTVEATGYPLNYQWREDGVDLAGATTATYTLERAQTNHAGNYTVMVSNPLASVTSGPPAVLTVNPDAAPGTVVAWGRNDNGQSTVPLAAQSGVTAIASGGFCFLGCVAFTVALKIDGTVVAWGNNADGEVTGTPAEESWQFGISSPVMIGGQVLRGVKAIAAGNVHTVALKNDGTVLAWGNNGAGQVTGNAPENFSLANPVTLGGEVLNGITAIAAGGVHTVALKSDGSVVAWGSNDEGQTTIPLAAQSGVTAIAAGNRHTVALKNDGMVLAWGNNDYGQTTVPVSAQSGVTAIAAGGGYTVALKNDGTVVAWGHNEFGQVTGTSGGDSWSSAIASPVTLGGQILHEVVAITAGGSHTVALKNDGTIVAWGFNGYGDVSGFPTTEDPHLNPIIASPVALQGQVLSGVTAIAAAFSQTTAIIGSVQLLPTLVARPNGKELILSWPTNAPGFTLQSTPDLNPPMNWIDSTGVPQTIGTQFTVTNTTSGGTRFYRLRKM